MGAQQVHVAGQYLRGIILRNGHDSIPQSPSVIPIPEEIDDGGTEGIVHNGVHDPVHKVALPGTVGGFVGGVLPDFTDEQSVGADLPDPLFQQGHEFIGQFIGYIQPKTVGTGLQPVGHNTILAGDDVFYKGGIHLIHRGQRIKIPPAGVAVGPGVEIVPGIVGGIFAVVGTLATESLVLIKIKAVGTGMGVNTVQDYLDSPGMGCLAQGGEIGFGTQHGVRSFVVAGVVAVAGKTLTDGVQVENGGTKAGNVVHFLGDTLEITAVKVVVQDLSVPGGLPGNLLVPTLVNGVGLQLTGEIALAGLREPIREDLVHGGAFGPVGGSKVHGNTADLPQVTGFHVGIAAAVFEQAEGAGFR